MTITVGTMSVVQRLATKGYSVTAITAIVGTGAPQEAISKVVSQARQLAEQKRADERRQRAAEAQAKDTSCRVREWKLKAAPSHYRTVIVRGPTRSIAEIIRDVAKKHGLTATDIACAGTAKALVRARQEAMFVCASETELSLPAIGRRMGNRDHSTIIHGIRQHAKRHGLPLPRGMKPKGSV